MEDLLYKFNKLIRVGLVIVFTSPAFAFVRAGSLTPAMVTGIVTNAVNGAPVVGARISVNNAVTWSFTGGFYSLEVDPPGTFPVTISKPGYDIFNSSPVTFQQGVTVTLDAILWESLNPPGNSIAALDTATLTVNVAWQQPAGAYELLYDDGVQDNFTVWAQQGNINAVRFSPLGFPVQVTGGSVDIGSLSNYPAGSNPLVPFQVAIFSADGSGGMPGNMIGGPFDVIPTQFGWIGFTFPEPVFVTSGNFYLGVIQGGNYPNAAGIAVDETNPQLRSVSKFVTGQGPWVPAGGNFMIRAVVNGPGGPALLESDGLSLLQYHVWRLRQGEELNPIIWTDLGTTTNPTFSDPGWFNFPCGPYLWGISAGYTGNRWSPVIFSNVLGKCWTVTATIDVDLSCTSADRSGTSVLLTNQVYPDTTYSATLDTSGVAVIPGVWKGTYSLTVTKFGYQDQVLSSPLATDTTLSVYLLQEKSPPSGLEINEKSLVAEWNAPVFEQNLYLEDWSSGDFSTNGWTTEGGYNWVISTGFGNPMPSAMFSWSPQVTNYSEPLTSKELSGENAPVVTLKYDIFLDNFGTTTVNGMAVEIWEGSSWIPLRTYTNSGGSFPWTTDELDITQWAQSSFRIRFRAYGGDSYDINAWNIDNILVNGSESPQGLSGCVLGYNFYLDNILSAFTPDTKYTIPGTQVKYGYSYVACVLAAYGSGYSEKDCQPFTSWFLWPPTNLTADTIENAVELNWEKPAMPDSLNQMVTPPGLIGYRIYRNSVLVDSITDPDTLFYYDLQMEPGTYSYEVKALYDLDEYGYPGQFDESMAAGPATVQITFGRALPFYEPWDQASFWFNDWRFVPSQGNWAIPTDIGNPPPAAEFSWEPLLTDYSYVLESPALDATPYHCASIHLDFDLKLITQDSSGQEKLFVNIYYNNVWHRVAEFSNYSSFDWSPMSIDISGVAGKGFIVGYEVKGSNSAGIIAWQLDNIHVYAVCYGPRDLQSDVTAYDVHLTWRPPDCAGGHMILNEGFEGDDFPPEGWTQVITDPASTWNHMTPQSPVGVFQGNYSAGVLWDYVHQDEWLVANNVLITGDLEFWSYAFQGSTHLDHYYVKISLDGGNNWTVLLDLSALPPYPSPNGYNQWENPYPVDLSAYQGEVASIAWQAVDGDGQGLWYSWGIDNCTIGGKDLTIVPHPPSHSGEKRKSSDVLLGYNIFRKDAGSTGFVMVNQNPVSDTTYMDPGLSAGQYDYFIRPLFTECGEAVDSDTIQVDVITAVSGPETMKNLTVFPVPAHSELTVLSDETVVSLTLLDANGSELLTMHGLASKEVKVPVSTLSPGVYFLRILTKSGSCFRKIVIL